MSSPVLSALRSHKVKDGRQAAADVTKQFPKYKPRPAENAVAFLRYCEARGIIGLPAAPATVAMFVKTQHAGGVSFQHIIDSLSGVEALHDPQWANPVATGIVAAALDEIAPPESIKAPRSWLVEEKTLFQSLPLWTQQAITRREMQRDKAFLNAMNEIRQAQKELGSTDALLLDRASGSEQEKQAESAHPQSRATA